MGTVTRTFTPAVSLTGDGAPPRDPVQLHQGALYLLNQRHQPPAAWTDNRLGQSQHYTGTIFLALSAVQQALAGAAAWVERRRRRDRTTFGPNGSVAVVKALSPSGGAGNDEDYSPVRDHPLADVLARPNPNETFGAMLGYQVLQWGLTGNGPVWLVPGAAHGRPVELYPLVEALLQPAIGPSLEYPEGAWRVLPYASGTGWANYGTLGARMLTTALLPGTEVRKVRAAHPLIRTDGYSPLTACGVQFDIMEAIDLSRHSAFMQGTQLGTIVYVPGLDEDGTKRVAQDFREKYAGPRNARKLGVASSPPGATGDFKIEQLGESPREMDYQSSWEQATRFVLATFGVHAAIAGLKDTGGYAELYAAREQFYGRMCDVAKVFADFYTHHLAGPWSKRPGDLRVKIQLPKPRNEETRQAQVVQLAQLGALPLNTALKALDFEPVKGGELPLPIYLKKLESDVMPQPDPAAALTGGMPGAPGAETANEPEPKPAPKPAGPTAGAPPRPKNPAGKGSLPPRPAVAKALANRAPVGVRPEFAALLESLSEDA